MVPSIRHVLEKGLECMISAYIYVTLHYWRILRLAFTRLTRLSESQAEPPAGTRTPQPHDLATVANGVSLSITPAPPKQHIALER